MSESAISQNWAEEGATIYLCYPLEQVRTAGALISAIIAGLVKGQARKRTKQYTLFAIDEMPEVALENLDSYLATMGGYGVLFLCYAQSYPQIENIYGRARAQALMSNFHHKVYYIPGDGATAANLSERFGSELRFSKTESKTGYGAEAKITTTIHEAQEPALSLTEVTALPISSTFVFTHRGGREYCVVAQRLNPYERLPALPKAPVLAFPVKRKPQSSMPPASAGSLPKLNNRKTPSSAPAPEWQSLRARAQQSTPDDEVLF